ncbi:hypothetical protein B0H19DRAFT_521579 [Mycena capillaripes]|nr:hypothetical protein B0H19DRAFT_521579 [Mycena capillaripes]
MAFTRGTTPGDTYQELDREIEDGRVYDRDSRRDVSSSQAFRDLDASPLPPTHAPQIIHMPQFPPSRPAERPPPPMPVPDPAVAMPSPIPASPSRVFETEIADRPPPSVRSPSIQLSLYPIDIPSASVFNDAQPSGYPQQRRRPSAQAQQQQQQQQQYPPPPPQQQRPPPEQQQYRPPPPETDAPVQRRPSSQAPSQRPRSTSAQDPSARRPTPEPQYHQPPPDNYIPSVSAEGAIREDARSVRSRQGYGEGSQRSRSMGGSRESLVPPPVPVKDVRHQKQIIADGLRYSNPDLVELLRRDAAAAKAETASSKSRPFRHVREPAVLKFPSPLSPGSEAAPLAHMRSRTMSGSTGKSGWTQPLNPVDLTQRPSLRRVKERRPISPSDFGSPNFGTITVEPPSQSSSQIPLTSAASQIMDQYLGPNYQTQSLPQSQAQATQSALPSGFMPQSVTVPAQITVPVTFKGKGISSPVSFPGDGGDADNSQPQPVNLFDGSNVGLGRPRSTSVNAQERPLSRAPSNSNLSRKSGKSGRTENVPVGPTLAPGPALTRQASNTSLRSTGSYAPFDAKSYVDPAYFAADTSAVPIPAPRSRRGSASSGLSYI